MCAMCLLLLLLFLLGVNVVTTKTSALFLGQLYKGWRLGHLQVSSQCLLLFKRSGMGQWDMGITTVSHHPPCFCSTWHHTHDQITQAFYSSIPQVIKWWRPAKEASGYTSAAFWQNINARQSTYKLPPRKHQKASTVATYIYRIRRKLITTSQD